MINLTLPAWVKEILEKPLRLSDNSPAFITELKEKLKRFNTDKPIVSVVIPAWNEEEGILHTLISLANTSTQLPVELLVVDNNSTDGTAALLRELGIKTLLETKQGVGHARTAGLHHAKGKYILTGDSDTLYPPGWITSMINGMLSEEKAYCVHGSYSFLPGVNTPRWQYGLYEMLSSYIIKKKERTQPFLNVLGYNSGFVRQKGIEVDGYNIAIQRIFRGTPGGDPGGHAAEDGTMALRLQEAGGKIIAVNAYDARVWTSDRRIEIDGGLKKALMIRIKKHLFKK
ncbi:glycosyltransferase family 2 protein [Panacibacter ginsenosidivorans]|uniref:Glycosyltransferase family 2 protein n=1 Tax=Panacibacter ginsenosidivorans TaxID=1813871 RepID=A0A5B8V551_9BACT|nr:glycosyltransferase family 2 protein [Panacibacter ginsenosidivorans]QEC66627.1 glycosyltransferase family 2 protein [Panacibacter ginsenosidivorans]